MPLITAAQLARVAPHAAAHIVAAIVDHADEVLPRYGLATSARLPDFLAHVLVESAYLRRVDEDLDYSAERLVKVWPSHFRDAEAAAPFAHQPRALADKVYGGRMGNTGPDDGWLNRGQGLIQTTGHDNIARLAAHLRLPFEAARAMLTSDAGMLEAAAATYCLLGAPAHADRGDIVGSTRAVNGGLNGLAERRAALALCRKVWPRVAARAASAAKAPTRSSAAPPAPLPLTPRLPLDSNAPPIPSQPKKASTMKKASFLAIILSLFGITAAHASSIDLTPLATAGIDYIALPVLTMVVPVVSAVLAMPVARFLGQSTASKFQEQFKNEAEVALSYAARQAEAYVGREDFHANVDSWIVAWAADYMNDHAASVAKKAGGVLTQKLEARLAKHEDVLAVKSRAANDNAGAPLQLAGAAA